MKKQFALMAMSWLTLASLQVPALAADPWFDKYDHNHDGHWTYDEFRKAHEAYYKGHPDEKRLKAAELRAEFDRRSAAHHGWVAADDVRDFHHW